jgi:hypothetical protein
MVITHELPDIARILRGEFTLGMFGCVRMKVAAPVQIWSESRWRGLAAKHLQRASKHTLPTRERRDRGKPHPVEDFLFRYYPYPLSLLDDWHPGVGVALEGVLDSDVRFDEKHYSRVDGLCFAAPAKLSGKERTRLAWIHGLLVATRDRPANFACHGLHEWAMVYRGENVRHAATAPLRLPQAEIDSLVESRAICCSHHDAFRFFANAARPLNRVQPSLDRRIELEQPGCVHANMDLYKWSAKSMPWSGSELLLDCFELAMELRDLDMRASPYDLTEWGREAVAIETPAGRRIYESEQKRLADLAVPLRERLITVLDQIPCQ